MDGTADDVSSPGGHWLLEPLGRQSIFTPEQFTAEQTAFAETASSFALGKVLPKVMEIEQKKPGVRGLLKGILGGG